MNESNNQVVSVIAYKSTERIMGWYDQTVDLTVHHIYLYVDSISTANHTFNLDHVTDMSYKPFSGGNGLFYLHTSQGVFTFQVDSDPVKFIRAFKDLRR